MRNKLRSRSPYREIVKELKPLPPVLLDASYLNEAVLSGRGACKAYWWVQERGGLVVVGYIK